MSISITLSDEQKEYVKSSGKVVLNACPGSGKTTTVAHKLYSLVDNWDSRFMASAGAVCLSFTNVAKNEIANKYKEISGFSLPTPHIVSTIDSFVNSYITLPFAHKFRDVGKRYRIVDDMGYLDNVFQTNWQLMKQFGATMYQYAPSKIDFTLNNGYSWDGHDKSTDSGFIKYGQAIKEAQIQMGLLKTSDSAFFALNLLKKHPRIAKYLAFKFQYLIIDEAQDTSEMQHSILEILYQQGLKNIDLVGDPYQCLYQWRDASPQLFLQKFDDKENWNGIYLSENRRSTKRIIDIFSTLRRTSEKAIIAIQNEDIDPPVHVIKYSSSDYSQAIKHYETLCSNRSLSSNCILVRGNTLRNSLLGKESEYSPWNDSVPYSLINAKIHMQSNEIKEAVKTVRRTVIQFWNLKASYSELREKENELKNDKDLNGIVFNLLRDLPAFNLPIKDWTIRTQKYLKDNLGLDNEPDFKIRKKNTKTFDKTTLDNPVDKYFKKFATDNNIPVTTIHQVKGMTFDSVFLFLSADSKGQNISLNDFVRKDEMPSEKQRLIYVAISRPRTLLCIGVPETVADETLREKFGIDVVII
ncbi:MAG: ATP-dependent helicase [Cytophagales bacterium]|nr:ATP-dependent helicase [Cytophagales bacterium]MCA6369749.1 ATP-dependent helicase [Cytophagales bacterium]MCA6377279.1 ATP-dependent helicase [Cytophagales bacterium]MCA6386089.1 ATP-dependent helicase [Cytophagales bacterium]